MNPTSDFRPQTLDRSPDPEYLMQEHCSWTAAAVMILFLALFWVQDRFTKNTKLQTPNSKPRKVASNATTR